MNVDKSKNKTVKTMGMNVNINSFFSKLKNNLGTNEITEDERLLTELNKALEEWENAELYFQSVVEPGLIDYAIHNMEASRTKYLYLLKNAREKGIRAENLNNSL